MGAGRTGPLGARSGVTAVPDEGVSPLVLIAGAVAGLVVLLVALLGELRGTAAPPGVSTLGRVALWLPLVQTDAQKYGVPAALELGLIAHESGGDYLAAAQDPHGTTDAGLGQINSGPAPGDAHWVAFGLQSDPCNPALNVAASVRILAGALAQNGGHVQAALYAYNAGSAAAGLALNPAYAPTVLKAAARIEAGPILAAWPVGGRRLPGGRWVAPTAAPHAAYVGIAAMGPAQAPASGGRPRWLPVLPPGSITATVNRAAVEVQPSSVAPRALQALMPPEAAYWWLAAPVTTTRATVLTVNASWAGPAPRRGSASAKAPIAGTAARASTTLTLQRR